MKAMTVPTRATMRARWVDENEHPDTRRRDWFRANLRTLREAQGCSMCGTHEGALVHHHINEEEKRIGLSKMQNYSLESFLDEVAKCTVLCRACHNKVHGRR